MKKVCYICLEQKECFPDKDRSGLPICHFCYGGRYKNRRAIEKSEQVSFADLKEHLERNW